MMAEAFIVDAVRTPVGRRGGGLSGVHPADLGAHVLRALFDRTGADPGSVDDVVFGCVDTIGPQAGDIARTAWLAAGLPEAVPGVTVDRQCGSSQQAVHFAAQAVLSETADLVVAGGVQNMSQIPISSAMYAGQAYGFDDPFSGSAGWRARYGPASHGTGEISQFRAADMIAAKWGIGRGEMEEFALASHQRALAATARGAFTAEIAPFGDVSADECPRRDTSLAKMAVLTPLRDGGLTTAALSSQVADAAAALLIASERAVREHGLEPRARIRHLSARGDDPVMMLTAPIAATAHALQKAGMTLDQIDLIEINEAFASVVLAWQRETGADLARVNVSGGAIALGHPLGATGARLLTTLLYALERTGSRYGMVTMCEGGGQANVTIIERLLLPGGADVPLGQRAHRGDQLRRVGDGEVRADHPEVDGEEFRVVVPRAQHTGLIVNGLNRADVGRNALGDHGGRRVHDHLRAHPPRRGRHARGDVPAQILVGQLARGEAGASRQPRGDPVDPEDAPVLPA
jgi:acetyl-CoA C-acetyltransferase